MSNRQSNPVPPQRDRVVAELIFPSTRFGIGIDAQLADKRVGLGVYLSAVSRQRRNQESKAFPTFSSETHEAVCNLYSLTRGQAAIRDWIRESMTAPAICSFAGIFPDQNAPMLRAVQIASASCRRSALGCRDSLSIAVSR